MKTISAYELLEYCQYEPEKMTPAARKMQALRLRRRYGLDGIQTPRRGLRYSLAEVQRKIQFIRIPTQPRALNQ